MGFRSGIIYVKKIPFAEGCRVLCYSEGRELKERAINMLSEKRFLEALSRLQRSVAKGSILHPEKVAQRLGRLKERHSAARLYEITLEVTGKPVYHQIAQRTKAHLFISVLAYRLLISIEHALHSHGDHRRWSTLREQLATHQRNTVIFTDAENKIHHLRVSGTPEKEHREIYRLLGVKDPLKRRHHLVGSRL